MKTTRRGFLGMFAATIAGMFAPKAKEVEAARAEASADRLAVWNMDAFRNLNDDSTSFCRRFTAADDIDLVGEVYLNGDTITDDCTVAYMATIPGETTSGWADLFKTEICDGHSQFLLDEDGALQTERKYGAIRWEQST